LRSTFLPFALPDLDDTEFSQIKEALTSGWITTGPKTRQFEAEFAAYVGARHAVAVNSCTAAMHLALEAIGLQRGDEVITTPYTFAASAEVIRYFDAKPVLVDIRAEDFNIDVDAVAAAITPAHKGDHPGAYRRLIRRPGRHPRIGRQP
jgi:dTDP-4-amino-4,6-dideoxygalactose transaminase